MQMMRMRKDTPLTVTLTLAGAYRLNNPEYVRDAGCPKLMVGTLELVPHSSGKYSQGDKYTAPLDQLGEVFKGISEPYKPWVILPRAETLLPPPIPGEGV